jgi:hypothetical protein
VIAALGRAFAGRWFAWLGGAAAALVFAGVFAPLGAEILDQARTSSATSSTACG